MILGTAGHVDHGKTALVRALTGVDTDRLAEEKRRGITIELGFAPLVLPDGTSMGVVDVPGHEAFVRTMLAGATGIDLALLAVAADEGVMPQTREHLEILRLLGTRSGVVALTKVDLADAEWLSLVEEEVRALMHDSPLAGAPIVRTSAVSGEGLDVLGRAVADVARTLPARNADDLFRMPVDRIFTVRGTGTVVTGTVWSGALERDEQVTILPAGTRARVRGIETHGAQVDIVRAGSRAAIALAGVEVAAIRRGAVLVDGGGWAPAMVINAEVTLLRDVRAPLGPRRRIRFHLGTSDVAARVVVAGGALEPGERRQARVVLSEPIVARSGDRFVLRSGSPVATLGGGVVGDPLPALRRVRPWPHAAETPADRLALLLAREGGPGVPVDTIPVRTGARPAEVREMVAALDDAAVRIGERLYGRPHLMALRERLLDYVDEHHRAEPLDPGIPVHLLRARLGISGAIADVVLNPLLSDGTLCLRGALVSRVEWSPRLDGEDARGAELVREVLVAGRREPPSTAELDRLAGRPTSGILRHLERQGVVVQVGPDRYYDRTALEEMIGELRRTLVGGSATPSTLRDSLGLTRKFLIPFLEYCDREGITERSGEGRVLRRGEQLDT